MLFLSAWCQTDEFTRQQADKLDSVTVKLMNQKRYEDAIKTKERELAILKALYGEKDHIHQAVCFQCQTVLQERTAGYGRKDNRTGCSAICRQR